MVNHGLGVTPPTPVLDLSYAMSQTARVSLQTTVLFISFVLFIWLNEITACLLEHNHKQ